MSKPRGGHRFSSGLIEALMACMMAWLLLALVFFRLRFGVQPVKLAADEPVARIASGSHVSAANFKAARGRAATCFCATTCQRRSAVRVLNEGVEARFRRGSLSVRGC